MKLLHRVDSDLVAVDGCDGSTVLAWTMRMARSGAQRF